MFGTYLRRELSNRRRQTTIIAIGMALAIALVILVNAVAGGVRAAQTEALKSVYGVGTDVTVASTATAPSGTPGDRFNFRSGAGRTNGTNRTLGGSRLSTGFGTTPFAASTVSTVARTSGVKAATGVLTLRNTTFSGSIPSGAGSSSGTGEFRRGAGESGGSGAGGPSSFGVTSISVLGYDTSSTTAGPIGSTKLVKGRMLTAADAGADRAVLDSDYATTAKKTVGDTVSLGGKTFTVVGVVQSTATDGASGSNIYIPLAAAQKASGDTGKVTSVYVTAASANSIGAVKTSLTNLLGSTYTVNTQADLASTVSGSLATASSLASTLGTWLSVLVLAAAFLIAVLFTVAGVTRRTREFGTLKAIGWNDRRIVGQVAGESLVQGLIGGALGIVLGLAGILIVNLIRPVLTASASTRALGGGGGFGGGFGGGGGAGGGFGGAARAAAATSDVVLHLPVTGGIIALAVGLAVLGGLIAGAFGGWRASALRPAEALRSVA